MLELNDFNQQVIEEFRANQEKVGGQLANMPVLLLTMTGAKSLGDVAGKFGFDIGTKLLRS